MVLSFRISWSILPKNRLSWSKESTFHLFIRGSLSCSICYLSIKLDSFLFWYSIIISSIPRWNSKINVLTSIILKHLLIAAVLDFIHSFQRLRALLRSLIEGLWFYGLCRKKATLWGPVSSYTKFKQLISLLLLVL